MEFYKVKDYPQEVFKNFTFLRRCLPLQKKIKTIAFHKPGAGLGDIILCIPVLRAIKRMFPEAKLYFWGSCNPVYDPVIKAIPYIDGYILNIEPGKRELFKGFHIFFRKYFRKFDLIISGQSKIKPSLRLWLLFPKIYISRNLLLSRWRIWNIKFYKESNVHVTSQMAVPLKLLGAGEMDYSPVIELPEEYLSPAQAFLSRFKGPFVCITPSSGNFHRNWEEEKYAVLADQLIQKGYKIIFLGSEKEKEIFVRIKNQMRGQPIIPSFEEKKFSDNPIYNVGFLKLSRVAIGTDGGGVHLASLAGCPVVALYGPNTPVKWGPLGERNIVIYRNFPCSPCRYVHKQELEECEYDRKCLRDITVDEVLDAVDLIDKKASNACVK